MYFQGNVIDICAFVPKLFQEYKSGVCVLFSSVSLCMLFYKSISFFLRELKTRMFALCYVKNVFSLYTYVNNLRDFFCKYSIFLVCELSNPEQYIFSKQYKLFIYKLLLHIYLQIIQLIYLQIILRSILVLYKTVLTN